MSARALISALFLVFITAGCSSETPTPGDITNPADTADVVESDTAQDIGVDTTEPDLPPVDVTEPDVEDVSQPDTFDVGQPDVQEDTGPALPFTISDEVEPVFAEILDPTAADWITTAHEGDEVLAGDSEALWRVGDEDVLELELGELFEADTVTASVGLPDGRFLIAAADGLYLADGAEVVASPLGQLFEGEVILEMIAFELKGSLVLWIAASDGLHNWKDDFLSTVTPEGLTTQSAHISLSASGDMWVAAGKDVYWLEDNGEGLEAWSEQDTLAADELQTDNLGYVWVESDGALSLRTPDATWFDLAELAPTRAMAHADSPHVWLDSGDALWHLHDAVLRPTDGPMAAASSQTDGQGRLIMATPEGVIRVNPGRSVEADGLPEGGIVASEKTVTIIPDLPQLVTEVTATIDGEAQVLDESFAFTLDPHALGEGSYAISVTVSYIDVAVTSSATFPFEVVLPTWEDDIEPLAAGNCFACHGDKAALELKLYTKDDWQSKFGLVVFKTSGDETFPASMPPGDPLSETQQELIQLWGEAGFL